MSERKVEGERERRTFELLDGKFEGSQELDKILHDLPIVRGEIDGGLDLGLDVWVLLESFEELEKSGLEADKALVLLDRGPPAGLAGHDEGQRRLAVLFCPPDGAMVSIDGVGISGVHLLLDGLEGVVGFVGLAHELDDGRLFLV